MPITAPELKITFDVHEYELSDSERQMLRDNLVGLSRQVEQFPVADLHVLLQGAARTNDVTVKLTLVLPGTTLVVDDHDAVPQPAFERSLDSLLNQLEAYKARLGRVPERTKLQAGTHKELHPTVMPDLGTLEAAVEAGDYAAFRAVTSTYDEELRMRVGRWVQRYPEFDAEIGARVEIADVVEAVFLLAFEGFGSRPPGVPLGAWLEELIDPAVKALQQHRDQELENIGMARSERGAAEGRRNAGGTERGR